MEFHTRYMKTAGASGLYDTREGMNIPETGGYEPYRGRKLTLK
jgi:hypothetical protein